MSNLTIFSDCEQSSAAALNKNYLDDYLEDRELNEMGKGGKKAGKKKKEKDCDDEPSVTGACRAKMKAYRWNKVLTFIFTIYKAVLVSTASPKT